MSANLDRVIVAYGSESGNAETLARRLCELPYFSSVKLELIVLNKLNLNDLVADDMLLVITSTFGDGEPPGNAENFTTQLGSRGRLAPFRYAVFALGDVAYVNFCMFGQKVDILLDANGATRVINRVDADLDYRKFFNEWSSIVAAVVAGDDKIGLDLGLQVKPYSETKPHQASIVNVSRLNTSPAGVYHIELDIAGSGIKYRAGDLLYVLPGINPELSERIAEWFDDDRAVELLQGKDLRMLSKTLLRSLASKSNNSTLKDYLKIRNRSLLTDYIYYRDLLGVLQDCGDSGYISLEELVELLPQQSPRAYSIASCGQSRPDIVSLCVRAVEYEFDGRMHFGQVSSWLSRCDRGDTISVFTRSNKEFHLADNITTPVIMVGAGTGIAPFIGFLQQLEQQHHNLPETFLIFGERHSRQDFLYQKNLDNWLNEGVLTNLVEVFSRDQAQKRYVQDAVIEQGEKIWSLLEQGAILYVCGSKINLSKAMDKALTSVAQRHGNLAIDQAKEYVAQLSDNKRYRRDLY